MAKYIDADRLKAEIEKRKKVDGWCEVGKDTADVYYARGFRFACDFALTVIDSLQQEQPEVDLEKITKYSRIKELPDGFEKEWLCYYHKNPEYSSAKFSHLSLIEREYIIASHFYELGRNSK